MTRTLSTALAAAHAASPRKGAECVILEALDGTRAAFTTWSSAQRLDLGLGAGEEACLPGINLSAVTLAAGLDSSSFEMNGPAIGEFTGAKVRGGKWRAAKVWLARISPGVAGYSALMKGTVGEGRVEGRRFILEVRNAADIFNQTWGRVLSPRCSATFGDSDCTVVRTPVAATVTAVTDAFRFTLNIAGTYADSYFALGSLAFLTGDLAGTAEARVFAYGGAAGSVELTEPLIAVPEVGDTLNIYRGCSQLLKSDDASIPTCLSYGNVLNFRGHWEVPGNRTYLRTSAPGASYA